MNINLAETVEDPIRSSCVSFWVGCVVVFLVRFASRFFGREHQESTLNSSLVNTQYMLVGESTPKPSPGVYSFLNYCGGLYGAIYVTCTIFIVPHIGFSVFFVCVITGQLLSAVLIDIFGLFHSERRSIHPGRIVGLGLTIAGGVLLLLSSNDQQQHSIPLMLALIIFSVLSGMILPVQTATNNLLKTLRQWDTMTVTGYSFATAAVALTAAAAVNCVFYPVRLNRQHNVWWYWMGGVIGAAYVAAAVRISPVIGYATFYVAVIAGQLSLSLVSDAFGLLGPLKPSARSPMAISGVLVAALGAFLVSYFKARHLTRKSSMQDIAHSEDIEERDPSMLSCNDKVKMVSF